MIPALRQLATALGTVALGGSIKLGREGRRRGREGRTNLISPTKRSPVRGKLGSSPSSPLSVEKANPLGKLEGSRSKSTKPRTRSPMLARVVQASVNSARSSSVIGTSSPPMRMVLHLSREARSATLQSPAEDHLRGALQAEPVLAVLHLVHRSLGSGNASYKQLDFSAKYT